MSLYGLDPIQFATRIVRPTLLDIGLYSPAAERLVLGTAMQESRLQYLKQIRGPAIGICQMEAATYRDIRINYLAFQPELRQAVDAWAISEPDADEMEGNLYFAVSMCRVHYRRVKEKLPMAIDANGLASYWKRHYNTALGSGTALQALPHFRRAIEVFSTVGDVP